MLHRHRAERHRLVDRDHLDAKRLCAFEQRKGDLRIVHVPAAHFAAQPTVRIKLQADWVQQFDLPFELVERGRTLERVDRSEEHTSELQSLMRISYAVFCLKK